MVWEYNKNLESYLPQAKGWNPSLLVLQANEWQGEPPPDHFSLSKM